MLFVDTDFSKKSAVSVFGVQGNGASVLPIHQSTGRYSHTSHVLVYLPLYGIDFLLGRRPVWCEAVAVLNETPAMKT